VQVKPDYTRPYVIFPLHYQPEATTMPRAGVFYDHLYTIELLSRYLPLDWEIYVKENPHQFNPALEGETGRLLRLYRDALKFPRVRFVSTDTDPFSLIDNAKAVITITGTMGWEALVRKKPVICFGPNWYDSFSNSVLRIKTTEDLRGMVSFIKQHQYNEAKLFAYLKAVEKNSFIAVFRRGLKDRLKISQEESVNILVQQVTTYLYI
jgi:hypothetical protein